MLPRYVVTVEERVFLEEPQDQRISDVGIQRADRDRVAAQSELCTSTPVVVEVGSLEVREHFIEILARYRGMKVVTVIEALSPTNKVVVPGRDAFRAKQRQTLGSEAHLIEIDLLREGQQAVDVPEPAGRKARPYACLVCVNRWPRRNRFELYPAGLRERLPRIGVPLDDPDPDVSLDLQSALEEVYEVGGYVVRVAYTPSGGGEALPEGFARC